MVCLTDDDFEAILKARREMIQGEVEEEPSDKKQKPDVLKHPLVVRELERSRLMHEFNLIYCKYEPFDIGAVKPIIVVDLHDLEQRRKGFDMAFFGAFLEECINKNTLEIFDNPLATRSGIFYELRAHEITGEYMDATKYAFNWYRNHCGEREGLEMELDKEAIRMRGILDRFSTYYITFTVLDCLGKERTIQAEVLRLGPGDWLLGMLRDAFSDWVAVIQFKEAPTGDTAAILSKFVRDDKWKKKLMLKTKI